MIKIVVAAVIVAFALVKILRIILNSKVPV